jgi:ribulose-5-phosphate 4-epimerase/fuculose-1-phosphate aldolase
MAQADLHRELTDMSAHAAQNLDRRPNSIGAAEWETRVQLAACYRLIAKFRLTDLVYTHISARVPGEHERFLLNPYGFLFDEVTASNLVKVDLEGKIVGETPCTFNPAGFTIHSAVHAGRPDIACVLHTHTRSGMAVAALKCGLLPISQFAMQFMGRIGYHDYEGIALDLDERSRLIRDLGPHCALILRNHGLLTAGRTIPEAFSLMIYLDRACEVQLAAQATGSQLVMPSPETVAHAAGQFGMEDGPQGDLEWDALIRQLDREDPSYRL